MAYTTVFETNINNYLKIQVLSNPDQIFFDMRRWDNDKYMKIGVRLTGAEFVNFLKDNINTTKTLQNGKRIIKIRPNLIEVIKANGQLTGIRLDQHEFKSFVKHVDMLYKIINECAEELNVNLNFNQYTKIY